MEWKIYFFIPFLFLLSSCTNQEKDTVRINGKIRNTSRMVYLQELEINGYSELDSVVPAPDGAFHFTLDSAGSGFYLLKIPPLTKSILLLLKNGENTYLDVNTSGSGMDYSVRGSPGSALIKDFYDHSRMNLFKADSLTAILRESEGTPGFYSMTLEFEPLFRAILEDQRSYERNFISRHPNSLASLIVLNYRLGVQPVLDPVDDFDLFLLLDSTLSSGYPGNRHVVFHHQRILEFRREGSARSLREEKKGNR